MSDKWAINRLVWSIDYFFCLEISYKHDILGLDRSALSSFMNQIHFLSYDTKNIFRTGSFLKHLNEQKCTIFPHAFKPLTLQHTKGGIKHLDLTFFFYYKLKRSREKRYIKVKVYFSISDRGKFCLGLHNFDSLNSSASTSNENQNLSQKNDSMTKNSSHSAAI